MILAVCLNPAVDLTYSVTSLRLGTSHAVTSVHRRAGGKGINSARVLAQLGEPVALCGFAGGNHGIRLREDLAASKVDDGLTTIAGETRQSVAVVSGDEATVFNEPGPTVCAAEWDELVREFKRRLDGCSAVLMSGSVPPGAPRDGYAQLVHAAGRQQVPTIVDATGDLLRKAIGAGPTIVAPNREELADTFGSPVGELAELLTSTVHLSTRSGGAAVVSAGPDGLVAVADGRRWQARPPRLIAGNPTGAGDALTAGLARGLSAGTAWPQLLGDAVALAAAAVAVPTAGQVDLSLYQELVSAIEVREIG